MRETTYVVIETVMYRGNGVEYNACYILDEDQYDYYKKSKGLYNRNLYTSIDEGIFQSQDGYTLETIEVKSFYRDEVHIYEEYGLD